MIDPKTVDAMERSAKSELAQFAVAVFRIDPEGVLALIADWRRRGEEIADLETAAHKALALICTSPVTMRVGEKTVADLRRLVGPESDVAKRLARTAPAEDQKP